jgi:hypothetical protein
MAARDSRPTIIAWPFGNSWVGSSQRRRRSLIADEPRLARYFPSAKGFAKSGWAISGGGAGGGREREGGNGPHDVASLSFLLLPPTWNRERVLWLIGY